jgi:lipopolysaccharide export system protein LptA
MAPRNRPCHVTRLALWLSLCLFSVPATHAFSRDSDEPIRVNARSVEANEKTGVAIYQGKVHAEQGRLSIKADRIEIHTGKGKSELITATGKPVKLHQLPDKEDEEIQGEARRINYHVSGKKLEMIGEVVLRRGEDLFTGGVLHYDLVTKSLRATGDDTEDGRIHAVIQPGRPDAGTATGP